MAAIQTLNPIKQKVIEKWREETAGLDEEGKILFRKNIENNPVKAKLCEKPKDWKLSSAFYKKEKRLKD